MSSYPDPPSLSIDNAIKRSRVSATPSLSASPSKDSFARTSPKLPFTTTPLINHTSLLPSASSSSATLPVLPNASSSNHHPMT